MKFLTPAFLGDANQEGRWRTPPFKALLRQWWRVAYAQRRNFQVDLGLLRRAEGELFGNAWLERPGNPREKDFSRSLVRLRLERWDTGRLGDWSGVQSAKVNHPEVRFPIGTDLYLGYGPLNASGQSTVLSRKPAINAGEEAAIEFAFPSDEAGLLEAALAMIDSYGTVGGRSRNGWGSFQLGRVDGQAWNLNALPLRDWREALAEEWPHAIGQDKRGPLIWQTVTSFNNWLEAMRALAIVRIGVRTQFVFPSPPPHPQPQPRHWLSYPITKHTCKGWGNQLRLPNSLRFKVRPAPDDPAKFVGVIFHMPCKPPSAFSPNMSAIQQTWESVHRLLDELAVQPAQRKYPSVSDTGRRNQLKALLDPLTLKRIPR